MKRIILFVLLAAVGCSKTPLDRAKENVKQYVKTMLNDPKQYESVSWGTLDSTYYNSFAETPRGNILLDSCFLSLSWLSKSERMELRDSLKDKTFLLKARIMIDYLDKNYPSKPKNGVVDTLKEIIKPFKVERDNYDLQLPLFRGYKIDHSFRIRGKKKEKELVKYRFYLDTALIVNKAVDQEIKAIDSNNKKYPLGLFPEDK